MFIVNVNFCIFKFYFLIETEPEAPRSETLVAGLRSVLASTAGSRGRDNFTENQLYPCCREARTLLKTSTAVSRGGASIQNLSAQISSFFREVIFAFGVMSLCGLTGQTLNLSRTVGFLLRSALRSSIGAILTGIIDF